MVFLALLLSFIGQSTFLISIWSRTADEVIHASAGYLRLKTGCPNNGFHNPPLLQNLIALPYIVLGRTYCPRLDVPRLARYANLFLGVLLVISIYLASFRSFGSWGGLLSMACISLSPTFIAHSSLATLDVGVTLFVFLAYFFLIEANEARNRLYFAFCGIFLGGALAAKFTSLVFLGLLPFVLLYLNERQKGGWTDYLVHLFIILIFCWLIIAASYDFSGCFHDSAPKDWPHLLRSALRPVPSDAIVSFNKKMEQAKRGGYAFIWGQKKLGGFWYYYPLVFALKIIPGNLLLLCLFLYGIIKDGKRVKYTVFVHLLVGLFFFVTLTAVNKSQSGIRHLFPFFPFLFFALGSLARDMTKKKQAIIFFAVLLNSLVTLWNFPNHLSYYNSLGSLCQVECPPVGGPDLDWGQNDGLLSRRMLSLKTELSQQVNPLSIYVNPLPRNVPRCGYVALSTMARFFVPSEDRAGNYQWLKSFEPVERIGRTWAIYRIDEKRLSVLNTKPFLEYLWAEGRFEEMVHIADEALREQKRVLWQRSRALLHLGKVDEAAKSYLLAAKSGRPENGNDLLWQSLCQKLSEEGGDERTNSAWALGCCRLAGLDETTPLVAVLAETVGEISPKEEEECWQLAFAKVATAIRLEEFDERLFQISKKVDPLARRFAPNLFKVADEWPTIEKMPFCPDKVTALRRLAFYCNSQRAATLLVQLLDEHPDNYQMALQVVDLWFAQREGVVRISTGTDSVYDQLDPHSGKYLNQRRQKRSFPKVPKL